MSSQTHYLGRKMSKQMINLLLLLSIVSQCFAAAKKGKIGGGIDTNKINALSRPMQLGMLYDRRTDSIIPGKTLWTQEQLSKRTTSSQHSTNYEVVAEKGIDEIANLLDISAELKLSFMAGQLTVSGSARFLNDKKTSSQLTRVFARYKELTKYEALNMDQLAKDNIHYPAVFDQNLATDVIVGITYGATAVFVFEKKLLSSENDKKIDGTLEVSVKSIPGFELDGKATVKISEKTKKETSTLRCQFYGDYALDSTPTTFSDAVKLYKKLPAMLGPNKERAVPMYAYLFPLGRLDSKAARIVRTISNEAVEQTSIVFNELDQLKVRCNDALSSNVAGVFHSARQDFQTILSYITRYKFQFQSKLSDILPRIRGGGAEERELLDLFEEKGRSPFSSPHLTKLFEIKEGKKVLLEALLEVIANTKFITQIQLPRFLIRRETEYTFAFVIRMFPSQDKYLKTLDNYLKESIKTRFTIKEIDNPWYLGNTTFFAEIKHNINTFLELKDFHKSNPKKVFLVFTEPAIPNKGKGIFLYIYNARLHERKRLIIPRWSYGQEDGKPKSVGNQSHNIISLSWPMPESGSSSVIKYNIYYRKSYTKWNNKSSKSIDLSSWHVKGTMNGKQHAIDICDLNRNTSYVFILEAQCIFGTCHRSQMSSNIMTKPGTGLVPLKHCKWIEEKLWRKEADTCQILEAADLKPITDRIKSLEVSTGIGQSKGIAEQTKLTEELNKLKTDDGLLKALVAKLAEEVNNLKIESRVQGKDCRKMSLNSIGEPVTRRVHGEYQGVWMKDPLQFLGSDKIWTMEGYGHRIRTICNEFSSFKDFKANRVSRKHNLPYGYHGTGAVVYGPFLYYARYPSFNIVKYDLRTDNVVAQLRHPYYILNGHGYTWGGYTGIDFAVDEFGLWILSGYSGYKGKLAAAKIKAATLETRSVWNVNGKAQKLIGNAFVICGVVYEVEWHYRNTKINHAYDTITGASWNPNIPFKWATYGSSLDYNPREKLLYAWDNGRQVTYSLKFKMDT